MNNKFHRNLTIVLYILSYRLAKIIICKFVFSCATNQKVVIYFVFIWKQFVTVDISIPVSGVSMFRRLVFTPRSVTMKHRLTVTASDTSLLTLFWWPTDGMKRRYVDLKELESSERVSCLKRHVLKCNEIYEK